MYAQELKDPRQRRKLCTGHPKRKFVWKYSNLVVQSRLQITVPLPGSPLKSLRAANRQALSIRCMFGLSVIDKERRAKELDVYSKFLVLN